MAPGDRTLHFSESFVISCGTITLDLKTSKVLLIRSRVSGRHVLPKGRKDVGETLQQSALRETYEETGYKVQLLPLTLSTCATVPSNLPVNEPTSDNHKQQAILCMEPVAVQQRLTRHGKQKIIFWFAAQGDATQKPDENTQMEYEKLDGVWASLDSLKGLMSFEDDRQIVTKVVELARNQKLFSDADF
jgi:8-oxo-dGTP pyrophosphatase MutT (NUDIX family)